MTSPQAQPLPNGHPSTPPPSDTARPDPPPPSDLERPLTSLEDDGSSKRPRDARLLHLVLQSLGIQSYHQRIPLQLLDFAYRYTSSILTDAQRLAGEGYAGTSGGATVGARGAKSSEGDITVTTLRQAIASRQSSGSGSGGAALPKEFLLEQAAERNRVALPKIVRERGGGDLQLPEEKYCLTGPSWNFREEWSSDEEDDTMGGVVRQVNGVHHPSLRQSQSQGVEDESMGGMDGLLEEDGDEEGQGSMEDIFGGEGEDTEMT